MKDFWTVNAKLFKGLEQKNNNRFVFETDASGREGNSLMGA